MWNRSKPSASTKNRTSWLSKASIPMTNLQLLPERVPYRLAIIMDGNGRWARSRGMPRLAGHKAGVENLRRILRACTEFGIRILTIYAFSTENWGRPETEVRGLMNILETVIDHELDDLDANGVQLRHLGTFKGVSPLLKRKITEDVERTRNNDRLTLDIAFNYCWSA